MLNPSASSIEFGPFTLTVTGSNFVETSVVEWDGAPRPTVFMSSTELRAEIPVSDVAQPGTFPVTVSTPSPGGGSSAAFNFEVLAPTPVVTELSQSRAVMGDAGFSLIVRGFDFLPASVVHWAGVPLVTTYVTSTSLVAQVPTSKLEFDTTVPITVFSPRPGGGASQPVTFTIEPRILMFGLPTNDLIYHGATRRIYASVAGSGGVWANMVAPIDPSTGDVFAGIPIGGEPGKLALSHDGTVLYVALNATGEIRVIDMGTLTAGATFSLGSGTFGTRYAEDIAVSPDAPLSVAVSMRFDGVSPRHAGVAIFDNGVMRGAPTSEHSGPNAIEYSSSSSTLYGLYNETDDGGLYTVSIAAGGPTVVDVTQGLVRGTSDIAFVEGRIYGTTGAIVDPVARHLLAAFDVTNAATHGSRLVVDAANSLAIFFEAGNPPFTPTLHSFHLYGFQSVRSVVLPLVPDYPGDTGSLIRWGSDGIAFRSASVVYLVRTSLVRGTQ
jgi:hypothetical protein